MSDQHAEATRSSERYELEDLFPDEAPENLHFYRVAGQVVLVVLLIAAFVYVFAQL
jgi:hypothetical protein